MRIKYWVKTIIHVEFTQHSTKVYLFKLNLLNIQQSLNPFLFMFNEGAVGGFISAPLLRNKTCAKKTKKEKLKDGIQFQWNGEVLFSNQKIDR